MMKEKDLSSLDGKVAIVTGPGRGLGATLTHRLAQYGAEIVIAEIDEQGVDNVQKRISDIGGKSHFIKADATNSRSVQATADEAKKSLGDVDTLVNKAGISVRGPAENLKEEDWDKVLDINRKGQFLCAQAAGRVMIQQKSGNIINIASAVGQRGLFHPYDLALPY